MRIYFRNSYGPRIWVAIMRYAPDTCGQEGNWETEGWWGINEGQQVYAINTDNRYAAFFAKAADGGYWAGIYGPVYVYHQAFDSCVNIGSTGAYGVVGMRLIDTHDGDLTINLVH